MGELFEHSLQLKVGNKIHTIRPVERRLIREDGTSFSMKDAVRLPGGLIVGEGDSGKTIFARMFIRQTVGLATSHLIHLRELTVNRHSILKAAQKLSAQSVADKPAMLILDGLDEKQDIARDIADLLFNGELGNISLWITSRPCDAASRLQECCPLFAKAYRLSGFTQDDIQQMAEGIIPDIDAFFQQSVTLGLESFLRKPGGAVLMIKAYATGKLNQRGRLGVMDLFVEEFARETRDGHPLSAADESDLKNVISATEWIAACLFLTSKESIWTGNALDAPPDAILLRNIPRGPFTDRLFGKALDRRLFEPLNSDQLRLTYSDMPCFLAGNWVVKHMTIDEFHRKVLPAGNYVTSRIFEMLAWAGQRNPDFCLPWIERHPTEFFACHEAIERFGAKRYFDLLLKRNGGLFAFRMRDGYAYQGRNELDGCNGLRLHALDKLTSPQSYPDEVVLAAQILGCQTQDKEPLARALTSCIVNRSTLDDEDREQVASALNDLCRRDRYDFLCQLKPVLNAVRRPAVSIIDDELAGNLLTLLWPRFITRSELPGYLTPPLCKTLFGSYSSFAENIQNDFHIDWIREKHQQKEERENRQKERLISSVQKIRTKPRKCLEHPFPGYFPALFAAMKKNPERAKKSLLRFIRRKHLYRGNNLLNNLDIDRLIELGYFTAKHFPRFVLTTQALSAGIVANEENHAREDILFSIRQALGQHLTDALVAKLKALPETADDDWPDEVASGLEREHLEQTNKLHLQKEMLEMLSNAKLATNPSRSTGKTHRATKPRTRAKNGELTQEDVAKDFHVSRKTVLGWENGKNNPWGYYKELRTDPNRRSAYQMLVNQVGVYYKVKKAAKDKGERFRITFAQFQETLLSHNKKVT